MKTQLRSFWFQIIDKQGGQYSDGTFVPVNWRQYAELKNGNYALPEHWKHDFPTSMLGAMIQGPSNAIVDFDDRFSWIKEE